MAGARVVRRPQAVIDIIDVWDHISDDRVGNADRWLDRLEENLKLWATQPEIGRLRDELATGLRSMPFGRYLVFFMPLADGIDVIRVIHASRDIDSAYF